MKWVFIVALMLSSVFLFAGKKSSNDAVVTVFDTDMSVFGFTTAVDEQLLNRFQKELFTSDLDTMYIYIDSPGGNVFTITRMIELMKASTKHFVCIARFAASAAFFFFENCDERLLMPSGVLMGHNAFTTSRGEIQRLINELIVVRDIITNIEKDIAKRMHIKYSRFKKLLGNELWINSKNAAKYNAIDGIVDSVSCTKELVDGVEERSVRVCSLFGCTLKFEKYSKCPLLTSPIK